MNGPAYFLVGMALVVASVATVAWCARYQRRPFHPRLPELAFRVLSIASAVAGAFVIVVFVRPGPQRWLEVAFLLLVYPAFIQTRRDFGAMRATGPTEVGPRASRYQQGHQIECGLRVIEGTQSGLGTRFKHGLATLEPRGDPLCVLRWRRPVPTPQPSVRRSCGDGPQRPAVGRLEGSAFRQTWTSRDQGAYPNGHNRMRPAPRTDRLGGPADQPALTRECDGARAQVRAIQHLRAPRQRHLRTLLPMLGVGMILRLPDQREDVINGLDSRLLKPSASPTAMR
jgi:hypothetical protein